MNSNTNINAKEEILKIKPTKGPSPPPAGEEKSGLNPTLTFVKSSKDTNADEETFKIKMSIEDTISKDNKTNY